VHVENFTYGFVTPVLAYTLSVLGSLAGLVATARARGISDSGRRARWLLLAAFAIGGTGIWVMHFVAMMGFSVAGVPVRYDIPITFASWLLAVVVVAIGLFIVGFGRPNAIKILAAGLFTGLGVATMHYTGMSAMRTSTEVSYDRNLVIASVVIAVVAATVALWFTVTLRRGVALGVAALIMGVAVSGMHYTAMMALRLSSSLTASPVQGLLPVELVGPIGVFVFVVVLVLLGSLLRRSDDSESADPTVRIQTSSEAQNVPGARNPSAPSGLNRQRTSAAAFIRPSSSSGPSRGPSSASAPPPPATDAGPRG
jgi:NO-binding membrane sensor protein with MHYT domain